MNIGDTVRIGAPYQYAFSGNSNVEGVIQKIDDEILLLETTSGSRFYVSLRLVLFIEIMTRKKGENYDNQEPVQTPTA
jgi:hypothetical protein